MPYEDLRYNEVRQKSVHNAFQRDEGIYDQLLYWRIRSLEFDLHNDHPLDGDERSDDWFVYHNLIDLPSSVHRLSDVLRMLAAFHRSVPHHEVVTVFLDMKGSAISKRRGRRRAGVVLDELLDEHLGAALYGPADLAATNPGSDSLRAVLDAAGWPTLAALRGRFIVVLTGPSEELDHYVAGNEPVTARRAFVSGSVGDDGVLGAGPNVVVYNMPSKRSQHAKAVDEAGLVSRVYYVNSEERWDIAESARCHHAATDNVNARRDLWATTSGPTGFPFRVHGGATPRVVEPGRVGAIWASSGDIWERSDSFAFLHRHVGGGEQTYEAMVSGPNSHGEPWTKGGIMARESLDPTSPYFAVLRPGSGRGLRVQFRVKDSEVSTALEPNVGAQWAFGSEVDQDTLAHVRLTVSADGLVCTGYGSVDGIEWRELGHMTFDQPLRHHGFAVSSHDQRRGAKYLFVPLDGADPPPFDEFEIVGSDVEGWFDWHGTRRWRTSRFKR